MMKSNAMMKNGVQKSVHEGDGTAGKPTAYYLAKSAEQAQAYIDRHIERRRESLKRKAEYKAQNSGTSSHANTAQKLRERLKAEFPNTKFFVRSDSYSGGDSIRVDWTDGAPEKLVAPIVYQYQHGSFDGMNDCYNYSALPEELGCSGVSYTFTDRELSEQRKAEIEAHFNKRFPGGNERYMWRYDGSKLNHALYESDTPEIWEQEYREKYEQRQESERVQREAEQAEREAQYAKEREEERSVMLAAVEQVEQIRAKYPVRIGEPTVTISNCEGYKDITARFEGVYSVKGADEAYKVMDSAMHSLNRGYDKTDFEVSYKSPKTGEACLYRGRYDIGDNDGGLLEHMRSCGKELDSPETLELVEWLKQMCAADPADEKREQNTPESVKGGKVVDFAAYKKAKQEAAQAEQKAAERKEVEETRDSTMMAIQMMDNSELAQLIRQCAQKSDEDKETRRGMCRVLLAALEERSRPEALRVFAEIKELFQN